jgi:hypothetical protein
MKLMSPVMIASKRHIGFQDSGWKSEIVRQMRFFGANRPLGVIIKMEGGLRG